MYWRWNGDCIDHRIFLKIFVSLLILGYVTHSIGMFESGCFRGLYRRYFVNVRRKFYIWCGNPRIQSKINKRVGSERRSKILSTVNLLREFFYSLKLPSWVCSSKV